MPRKTDTVVVRTIGIDTGKNALHMIGLDERGASRQPTQSAIAP